jgi:hypothetical protein
VGSKTNTNERRRRMTKPNQKDAELLIRLQSARGTPEMFKAFNWAMTLEEKDYEEFEKKYPRGSEGYTNFIRIASQFELIGVLVKYGTINEDLVLDFYYDFWDKLGPIVKGFQKARGSPRWFENYEYLAKKKAEWVKDHPAIYGE